MISWPKPLALPGQSELLPSSPSGARIHTQCAARVFLPHYMQCPGEGQGWPSSQPDLPQGSTRPQARRTRPRLATFPTAFYLPLMPQNATLSTSDLPRLAPPTGIKNLLRTTCGCRCCGRRDELVIQWRHMHSSATDYSPVEDTGQCAAAGRERNSPQEGSGLVPSEAST